MFQVVWKRVWGIGKFGLRVYDLLLSEILEISGATQSLSFVVSDAPPFVEIPWNFHHRVTGWDFWVFSKNRNRVKMKPI